MWEYWETIVNTASEVVKYISDGWNGYKDLVARDHAYRMKFDEDYRYMIKNFGFHLPFLIAFTVLGCIIHDNGLDEFKDLINFFSKNNPDDIEDVTDSPSEAEEADDKKIKEAEEAEKADDRKIKEAEEAEKKVEKEEDNKEKRTRRWRW